MSKSKARRNKVSISDEGISYMLPKHNRNKGFKINKPNLNMSPDEYERMVEAYKKSGVL